MDLEGRRSPLFLGLDLGGTNVKAGVVDDLGRPLASFSIPTRAELGPEIGLETLAKAADRVIEKSGVDWADVTAIGLGAPGTVDDSAGCIVEAANLPLWNRFPLAAGLGNRLQRPATVLNDANAAAFGEAWAGAGRGVESLVLFTIGTGIGCGIVDSGRILRGTHGLGGECGHMPIQMDEGRRCSCGKRGHLEAYASATSLVRRASEILETGTESVLRGEWRDGSLTAEAIARAASGGDRLALRLMRETAKALAVGATIAVHTIDPDLVLFGGGMIGAGPGFLRMIRAYLRAMVLGPYRGALRVEYAALGGDAGFIGAAGWARRATLEPADERGSRRGSGVL